MDKIHIFVDKSYILLELFKKTCYNEEKVLWGVRMMLDDVCHFIPFHKDYHSIHTINFVLETDPQKENTMKRLEVVASEIINNLK